jgi:hypothetical protein
LYLALPFVKWRYVCGCGAKRLQNMKRLLATAIAFSTLVALPAVAEQKSQVYLILIGWESITPIPVRNLDQCEEQGAIFLSSTRAVPKTHKFPDRIRGFECIEGVK